MANSSSFPSLLLSSSISLLLFSFFPLLFIQTAPNPCTWDGVSCNGMTNVIGLDGKLVHFSFSFSIFSPFFFSSFFFFRPTTTYLELSPPKSENSTPSQRCLSHSLFLSPANTLPFSFPFPFFYS